MSSSVQISSVSVVAFSTHMYICTYIWIREAKLSGNLFDLGRAHHLTFEPQFGECIEKMTNELDSKI